MYEVQKVSRRKKSGFKKTTKKRKSTYSEPSAPMAPGRVMAVPPGGSKRLLELEEEPVPPRVTRSKATLVTNHEESNMRMDLSPAAPTRSMRMDLSPDVIPEQDAPTRASNQALESDVIPEQDVIPDQQQLDGDDEGKFF